MSEAVIVASARSPIGRAVKGTLKDLRPDDMAVQMVRAVLDQVRDFDPTEIEDIIAGSAQPNGEADFNIARNIAVEMGWNDVPGATINRYCSSSLQTTRMAFHAIRAGEGDAFLSVGVESVSQHALAFPQAALPDTRHPMFQALDSRAAALATGEVSWQDPCADGLVPDLFMAMGQTAENVAQLLGVTRRDQDEFAAVSQNRAEAAIARGFYARDITPITLADGRTVTSDDGPRPGTTADALAALQPAFRPSGTVTAGNCCPLNDGAAAILVMSEARARALGLRPRARIVSTAVTGLCPEIMGLGPVEASGRALDRAGLSMGDIDLVEINEAFAAQVVGSARQLGIDFDKLNVNGGAIALGHPFGMTGARITNTLLNALEEQDGQFGLETMCVGGGQGMAMVVERLR